MKTTAQLEQELAALLAPADVSGTLPEIAAYETVRSVLEARICTAKRAAATLVDCRPRLDADILYAHVLAKVRDTLCEELIAIPKACTNLEFGTQQNLKISIIACDRGLGVTEDTAWCLETTRLGKLLKEAGHEWRGSLPEVERRIRDAKARVDDAQARLDDALLDDDERATRDAESRERAAAFNALSKEERKRRYAASRGYVDNPVTGVRTRIEPQPLTAGLPPSAAGPPQ